MNNNKNFTKSVAEILEAIHTFRNPNLTPQQKIEALDRVWDLINTHNENQPKLEERAETLDKLANKVISDSSGNDTSSSIIESITKILDSYNEIIGHLDLFHLTLLLNISGVISFLFILLSITSIFYGDYLIRQFKLEEKYPKFAKWIQVRRQLQHYSLLWNLFLAFFVILTMFLANIFLFFYL